MTDFNKEYLQGDEWINAIHKWCKAKDIDPQKAFAANGWSEEGKPKQQTDIEKPVVSSYSYFRTKRNHPINTSIFEEAIIIEE